MNETKVPEFSHYSVLLHESVDGLAIKPGGIYVDCTLGGGGHSLEIVRSLTDGGRLIAVDQDDAAIAASKLRLHDYIDRISFVHDNFSNVASALETLGIEGIDGAVIDLGVSSYQLDTPERGFSYMHDAPLDMRMNPEAPLTAREVVNTYSEERLKKLIFDYSEERFAGRIASAICNARELKPIETTYELVDIVRSAISAKAREDGPHPAKRTFQAIRIEVNSELAVIEPTLNALIEALNPGGRLSVITFHSLEDRIVKQTFAAWSKGCTCPPDFPVCVCGNKPKIKQINRKPILPSEHELDENPRSRSAKLRIIEKL
ncbi:MAG: 16S rRNA (cytosine(1402)-N(4))-methyltransferase RsmH [Clostridiales bacterium]|nr:16S rRNA (cytosine(1402)-N(4))-methyltransferase RsmH [Clostridiales bacterium]